MKKLLGLLLLLGCTKAYGDLRPAVIYNTSVLQTGATFYVSSGTVTNFRTSAIKFADGSIIVSSPPVQNIVQSSTTVSSGTTSSTFGFTYSSATITPSSAAKRVKVTVSGMLTNGNAALANAFYSLTRGATNLGNGTSGFGRLGATTGAIFVPLSLSFIDNPATTSATQYIFTIRNDDGATTITFGLSGVQTMILEEVP